jgi:hypothetical protein
MGDEQAHDGELAVVCGIVQRAHTGGVDLVHLPTGAARGSPGWGSRCNGRWRLAHTQVHVLAYV